MDKMVMGKRYYELIKANLADKKLLKPVFENILIFDECIYSSDGRAAVKLMPDTHGAIADGVYKVISAAPISSGHGLKAVEVYLEKVNIEYPGLKQLFESRDYINSGYIVNLNQDSKELTSAALNLYAITENAYDVELLSRVCLKGYNIQMNVWKYKEGSAVWLKSEFYEALVMPYTYKPVISKQ